MLFQSFCEFAEIREMILNITAEPKSYRNGRWNRFRMLLDLEPDRLGAIQAQDDGQRSVQFALTRIQGKWKIRILSKLQHGPVRLSQLRKMLPPSQKKELTPYVRELESAGLIVRIDRSGRRPYVEYSLSDPLGVSALHLFNALTQMR
jgi:DNA-binding HxlR family transcriptional regulator